ncbi:hypothetical protein L9F63_028131, partial [Diploptera punctata]
FQRENQETTKIYAKRIEAPNVCRLYLMKLDNNLLHVTHTPLCLVLLQTFPGESNEFNILHKFLFALPVLYFLNLNYFCLFL